MIKKLSVIVALLCTICIQSQDQKSEDKKLQFSGDFRFRVEHDWDSQKGDGTYRDDRSRLRYRFRLQAKYKHKQWAEVGARIRNGNLNDQQGPHTTLGGDEGEFSTTQIGLEKVYFLARHKHLSGWIGKNTFPFYKQNEVFWNDNVFPEGIALKYQVVLNSKLLSAIEASAGHFVIASNNKTFDEDSYLQGIQLQLKDVFDQKLTLYPSFFYFNQLSNLPDKKGDFKLDYAIVNMGLAYKLPTKMNIVFGVDLYKNLEDINSPEIPTSLTNEKEGYVVNIKFGKLKKANDWLLNIYYAQIEKYAIVDYFAQNDWGRFDYSSFGATGSRLSNTKGFEVRVGYAINERMNLIFRGYHIEQIQKEADFLETGSRARLDFNFKF